MMNRLAGRNVVVLAGGVGGAKLVAGLAAIVPPEQLTAVVNTGDDFRHLGVMVCPDLDTVMYTLAGLANGETGWGRLGESWRTMGEVSRYGGPTWFSLGDLDLGVHLTRSHWLAEGMSLTAVTRRLCTRLDIPLALLPMSDQPAPTKIETVDGRVLPFQEWFVKERWQPDVKKVVLPEDIRASAELIQRLEKADIVVIAPSNPFVSIDPILNVYPVRAMLMDLPEVVVAVSPIVGGHAVKGPAAKMMQTKKMAVTPVGVAEYYGELLDGFVYDVADKGMLAGHVLPSLCVDTMMVDEDSRERVARDTLAFALDLADSFSGAAA